MRPEERDPAYLWDMLEHARFAVELTQEMSFRAFLSDRVKQLAMERVLEIVGEAARRVSEPFRLSHPEIPWALIIAHRNILAHEYDEIRQERLWKTATEDAPVLVAVLERLVPPSPQDRESE